MKIIITKNKNGKYFWKLVAGNGRTLAHSEIYNTKRACDNTVSKVLEQFNNPTPIPVVREGE